MIKEKNKGEWSEFYAFVKLLSDRTINSADENLNKIPDIFYPILKIIRNESSGPRNYEFAEGNKIRVLEAGVEIALVEASDLKDKILSIFEDIKKGSEKSTFSVPIAEELMDRFKTVCVKASSSNKEDIILKIHDKATGIEPEVGFSIKSMLGGASTLLNASGATNFIYEITGLSFDKIEEINKIDTRSKVRDRLSKVLEFGGSFKYVGMDSEVFTRNLRKVDTVLPEIAAEFLLAYFLGKGATMSELIKHLGDQEIKILSFDLDKTDYEFKIRSLLHNVALGMVPNTTWDGMLKAHGGYIIVREDGEVVCYHVYNADEFRAYLFNNTRLETPGTSKHNYGYLYQDEGRLFLKLNLQIRFIK